MPETITYIGFTTGAGVATEVTMTNVPDIRTIGMADLFVVGSPSARAALTVVTVEPTSDTEIQLTAGKKFKLFMTSAVAADDILILQAELDKELVRT